MARRPTIKDVAADAGVSPATVSLVIRHHPRISGATAARVRASMQRVGYVYNRRAAEMRTRRTMSIGLVVTDIRNPYFAELAMAIENSAFEAGYTVLHGYSHDDPIRQNKLVSTLVEQRVDGMLLLPASGTDTQSLHAITGSGPTPYGLVARRIVGLAADYVGIDNIASGRLVGAHLRGAGVRRLTFLGGPSLSSARQERLTGLRTGLGLDSEAEIRSWPSAVAQSGGIDAVNRMLLADGHVPDAIVAYNDIVAYGVLTALKSAGVVPGRDVAVAGFDDLADSLHQSPALTTVDGLPGRIGASAIAQLLQRIDDPKRAVAETLVTPNLHVRESTSAWSRTQR